MKVPYINVETENYKIEGAFVSDKKGGGMIATMFDRDTYMHALEISKKRNYKQKIDEFVKKTFLKW